MSITGGSGTCYGGCGYVFELTRDENGSFQDNVLHNFQNLDGGGVYPEQPLVIDGAGNLYGTTPGSGGSCYQQDGFVSCGTVFELSLNAAGGWTETVLHNFTTDSGGMEPQGIVLDSAGNIYGTAATDGAYNAGNVFELVRGGHGE